MNIELMIDSINIITEKSINSIEQIVRKDKPINDKMKFVSLHLNEMKSEIYEWICHILNSSKNLKDMVQKLLEMKKSTDEQLKKYRLHILLKKKINKLKKQSFLNSIDSHDNFFQDESKIQELEKSLLHIQKDLNIQSEQEDQLAISSIIQKSRMLNLDQSALKEEHNISTISEYEVFKLNLSEKRQNNDQNNPQESTQLFSNILSTKFEMLNNFEKQKPEIEPRIYFMKENEQKNILLPPQIENSFKTQKLQQQDKRQSEIHKILQPIKIMKKKKKSIYSTISQASNLSKDDLLGNILEECFENQNK